MQPVFLIGELPEEMEAGQQPGIPEKKVKREKGRSYRKYHLI